ncbi:hypothetical protein BDF14DRAFT_1716970 [Spinellus fusiger]|nr:hypothetical protein BDF14DRAFT_1716970 [Spinellus fusiger]
MPRDTDTDTDTPIPTKKSIEEEDIFSEAQVKQWQLPRIKAWESRRSNPEAYAFRLTVPGVEQRKGPWDAQEHALFMQRCQEWKEKTKFMGSSWGLFSLAFPHRVGYQCMNYYRRLVCHGTLIDDAYTTDDGKIRCLHKSRFTTLHDAVSLGPEWETEKVKAIEKNVDLWIRQYHCGIVA